MNFEAINLEHHDCLNVKIFWLKVIETRNELIETTELMNFLWSQVQTEQVPLSRLEWNEDLIWQINIYGTVSN